MRRARNSIPASAAAAVAVALAGFGAAGCQEHFGLDGPTAAALDDPSVRHPIGYAANEEALIVEVPPSGDGLSPNQTTDVYRFIDKYRSESTGPLRISASGTSRGHFAVARTFRQVEDIVDRAGVPPAAVLRERDRRPTRGELAVRIAFERPLAVPPHCRNFPEDLGRVDREKIHFESFGCATQRNLALTVANARDLQGPQEETPRLGERRHATWTKYAGTAAASSGGGAAAASGSSNAAPSATPTSK